MQNDYPDFQGLGADFTPSYITPHPGERTLVSKENTDNHRKLYELMEEIRKRINKSMSMQEARSTVQMIIETQNLISKR